MDGSNAVWTLLCSECTACIAALGLGIAGTQAILGDAVGVGNMLVPSYRYEATTRAGPGGATLGLLRASQFSSLVTQVHM